jgi:F420-0:gamma-glutamyl ligase
MASVLQQPEVGPDSGFVSEDTRRLNDRARTVRERQKQSLDLQRGMILRQTATQPARRGALEAALAQIDGQIAKLG